jgi:hypothetical protein
VIDEERLEAQHPENIRDSFRSLRVAVIDDCTLQREGSQSGRVAQVHSARVLALVARVLLSWRHSVCPCELLYKTLPERLSAVNYCQKIGARLGEELIRR